MIRLAVAGALTLALSGCGATPVWLSLAAPALGYMASVNDLGAETLRFIDNRRPPAICPVTPP